MNLTLINPDKNLEDSVPDLSLEELAKIHNMTIVKKPTGTPTIEKYWDELYKHLHKRKRKDKNMNVDSLGLTVLAWDNGSLRSCAIRRERDNKGKFLPFTNTLQFPAVIIDSKEKVVLKQDEQAKLYVAR